MRRGRRVLVSRVVDALLFLVEAPFPAGVEVAVAVHGKTVNVHLKPGPELEKARREVAEYERFRALTGQIVEVNKAICDARPPLPRPTGPPLPPEGKREALRGARGGGGRRGRLLEFMLGDHRKEWLAERPGELDAGRHRRHHRRRPRVPSRRDESRGPGQSPRLLRDQRAPDALPALPLSRHVRRLQGCGGRVQGGHRPAPQTVRHALVLQRRDRNPHPAMPASHRPLGRHLAAATQPDRSGLTRHLTTQTRSGHQGQPQVTRESPTNSSHTPAGEVPACRHHLGIE